MGRPVGNHRGSPPQGADLSDAGHLRESHNHGQRGNQTDLRMPCLQNQNEGPQLRLDLQAEEQREDSQMGPGRRGSAAGSIDNTHAGTRLPPASAGTQ